MDYQNHANKYEKWQKQYNWDTCKANRKEFGLFIADFLTSDSRVINLNGIYGSGKTEFIRRLYIELAEQNYPVVYIDVWESDFSNNPLAVICSELLQQIELIFSKRAPGGKVKEKNKAKRIVNTLKSKLGLCLKFSESATVFTGDPATIGIVKAISTAVNAVPTFDIQTSSQKLIEVVQKNHVDAIQAIKDIKENITFLSELIEIIYELKIPIVVLIDELDRCRPTYAIEVLESIKHFFDTKGCTFLVATNTVALEHSVNAVYGQNFEAKLYLRKFFDRKVTLPQVSLLEYLDAKELDFEKYEGSKLILYPFNVVKKSNIAIFAALFEENKIELRDVEQILNRFFAGLDYALSRTNGSEIVLNTVVLLIGLLEQHLDKVVVGDRTNMNFGAFSIRQPARHGEMIDFMFNCVTTAMSDDEYTGGGDKMLHNTPQEMLKVLSSDFSKIRLPDCVATVHVIVGQLSNFKHKEDCNYWMWEDHQKIIELSGHIE
jgi:hypothetical protein